MDLFNFLISVLLPDCDDQKKKENKRDSWDHGSVSERHFGRDSFGYSHDEEDLYDSDERYDDD